MSDNNFISQQIILKDKEFVVFSRFIEKTLGIRMPPSKKDLLQSRLNKRLKILEISSFEEYMSYISGAEGEEEIHNFNDLVTTHKTYFYREDHHFDYIVKVILPNLLREDPPTKDFFFWSAGCSTGEEPYTLAFYLEDFLRGPLNTVFKYRILCSDISVASLARAEKGVYSGEQLELIPTNSKKNYFLRGKDPKKDQFKIVPEIRDKMIFKMINLKHNFSIIPRLDLIFCRNVMIYFDLPVKMNLIRQFGQYLKSDGHLIIGHAGIFETKNTPFKQVATNIYQKI